MTTSIARLYIRISRITHTTELFLTLGLISLVMPLTKVVLCKNGGQIPITARDHNLCARCGAEVPRLLNEWQTINIR